MEARFTENQKGYWILYLLVFAIATIVATLMMVGENMSEVRFASTLTIVLLCVVGAMFFRLRTEVYTDRIKLAFGIGTIRRSIQMDRIQEVHVVRNKWYYGWGIRYFGRGWMWNIWGLDAVELQFKGKKGRFRIGSQNPEKLKAAIEQNIHN